MKCEFKFETYLLARTKWKKKKKNWAKIFIGWWPLKKDFNKDLWKKIYMWYKWKYDFSQLESVSMKQNSTLWRCDIKAILVRIQTYMHRSFTVCCFGFLFIARVRWERSLTKALDLSVELHFIKCHHKQNEEKWNFQFYL